MKSPLVMFLIGMIVALLAHDLLMPLVGAQSRALPGSLIYGRTTLGVNVPVQVDAMGVVQVN